MIRAAAMLVMVLALSSCTSMGFWPDLAKPSVVHVPVNIYVPVPPTLTQPCPIAKPENYSVVEAVRVARERRASLEKCNADKAAIKAIQGTKQ